MKTLLLPALLLTLLAACSKPGTTPAQLQVSFGAITSTGPVVITGKGDNGHAFSRVLTGSSLNLDLPNGNWNFLAMAWDAAGLFQGNVRCGFQKSVNLSGGQITVDLVLTKSTCTSSTVVNQDLFKSSVNSFKTNDIQLCRVPVADLTSADECSFNTDSADSRVASIASIKLGLRALTVAPGSSASAPGSLMSGCHAAGSLTTANSVRLPLVNSDFFWPVAIQGFLQPNCAAASGMVEARWDLGHISSVQVDGDVKMVFAQFDDQKVCQVADQLPINTLKGIGLGTAESPYGLCRLRQMHDWQQNFVADNYDDSTVHVQLLKDVNLLPGVKLGSLTSSAMHECLEDGDTMIPIGHQVTSTSPCTFSISGTAFQGQFHGLGRKISHFRFQGPSAMNDVGLFAVIEGGVSHLVLEKFEVEGDDQVGALAGHVAAGTVGHVKVHGANVKAYSSYAGGVAGLADVDLSNVHVTGGDISARDSSGGIVGKSNANVEDCSFHGISRVTYSSGGRAGGVAGEAGNIHRCVSAGLVQGYDRVGGIAGGVNDLAYVRSTAAVVSLSNASAIYAGGLGGDISGSVLNSVFAGSFSHSCHTTCYVGAVGNVIGSVSDVWASMPNLASTFGGDSGSTNGTDLDDMYAITSAQVCPGGAACSDPTTEWTFNGGDLPRLHFESSHPCADSANRATVAAQISAGRGSLLNPIGICNVTQLADAATHALHFRLLDDIPALEYTGTQPDWNGKLDGKGRFIYGGHNSGGPYVMFDAIMNNAEISNVHLADFFTGSNNTQIAALAATNNGTVDRVQAWALHFIGTQQMAGLVVDNQGTISRSRAEGVIEGVQGMGGLAYSNSGDIIDSISAMALTVPSSETSGGNVHIGGIVATNSGDLTRVEYRGSILAAGTTNYDVEGVGGIAGLNTGDILHALLAKEARITVNDDANTGGVGGLAGIMNGGTLDKSIVLGAVAATDDTSSSTILHGVGDLVAGTMGTVYSSLPALEQVANGGSLTTSYSSPTCSGGSVSPLVNGTYYFQFGGDTDWYQGAVASYVLTYTPTTAANCASGNWYAYSGLETAPTAPTASLMTSGGFPMVDMDTAPTAGVLSAFQSYLNGGNPTAPTTWVWEDGAPKLFRFED